MKNIDPTISFKQLQNLNSIYFELWNINKESLSSEDKREYETLMKIPKTTRGIQLNSTVINPWIGNKYENIYFTFINK